MEWYHAVFPKKKHEARKLMRKVSWDAEACILVDS
jgi:hypothetical protein